MCVLLTFICSTLLLLDCGWCGFVVFDCTPCCWAGFCLLFFVLQMQRVLRPPTQCIALRCVALRCVRVWCLTSVFVSARLFSPVTLAPLFCSADVPNMRVTPMLDFFSRQPVMHRNTINNVSLSQTLACIQRCWHCKLSQISLAICEDP